jgi:plasmid stabilization system protein ParE
MQRSVRFHPAALQDADEAGAWYAERSLRAAVRFLDEWERLIDVIAVSPDRFQSFDKCPHKAEESNCGNKNPERHSGQFRPARFAIKSGTDPVPNR